MNGVRFTGKPDEDHDERFFDFEKLEVYQLALDFLDRLLRVTRVLPRELRYAVGDQLIRAALSISNNLAEGAGKRSPKEKARYYGTAIDSARECISMLNVLVRQESLDGPLYEELRAMGRRVTGMLYGLLSAVDRTPYTKTCGLT